MEPMTMALIAGAVSSAIKGGTKAYGEYGTAQDLKLTEEQRRRLRELERLQAEDALGMSTGQREQYRSQAMSPVQTAEREALARFGASQSVADIGQGASFRQQQALKQASENARAEVSRSVAERDAQVAQQQAEEKARLETQQNQAKALERQAALSLVGGVAEGALGAVQIGAEHKYQEQLYDKRLKDLRGGQAVTSQGAQTMLGIGTLSGAGPASEGKKAVERLNTPTLGVSGPDAVDGMTRQEEALMMYTNPGMTRQEEQVINITENLPTGELATGVPLHYGMFNSTSNEDLVPMLESVTETKDGSYGTVQSPDAAILRLQKLKPERQADFFFWLQDQRNKGFLKDNFWNIVTLKLIAQGY
tara:strand:- start:1936 stop:3024 length:1089 start_codon:yes stop_codon:yes gene_type:complete